MPFLCAYVLDYGLGFYQSQRFAIAELCKNIVEPTEVACVFDLHNEFKRNKGKTAILLILKGT